MRVSAKSEYALRTLVHLASVYHGEETLPVSIRTLAEQNDIPKRFLEHIMIEMRTRGWVRAIAGRVGGFVLAATPERINMAQVVRHFDDMKVSSNEDAGESDHAPAIHRVRGVFEDIHHFTVARLEQATLASLVQGNGSESQNHLEDFASGSGI